MKAELEHNDATSLTLRPQNGADEILIVALTRYFTLGGLIQITNDKGQTRSFSYKGTDEDCLQGDLKTLRDFIGNFDEPANGS